VTLPEICTDQSASRHPGAESYLSLGGTTNNGTVFKLTSAGIETVLYDFKGGSPDGTNPNNVLTRDSAALSAWRL